MPLVLVSNNEKIEKPVKKTVRKSITGQIVLVLLGVELLFLASFTSFDMPVGAGRNLAAAGHQSLKDVVAQLPARIKAPVNQTLPDINTASKPVRYSVYTPQAPMAIFVGYVLGCPLATVAAAIFLFLGIVGPFFQLHPLAGGGGPAYYLQPGFGYLLGTIACTWVVGYLTRNKRSSFSQILGVASGLVTVHAVGLAYLVGACLFFAVVDGFGIMPSWHAWVFEEARNLTWYPLPYDFVFALIAVGLGFPFRYLADVLTAPDLSSRVGNNSKLRELLD